MLSSRTRMATAAAAGMLLLILDSPTALSGAAEGIRLCIQTVIPSLFPFLFLSSMLTDALAGTKLPILSSLCKLLHIPIGSESILITGLLGGYPVGGQTISIAANQKQLNRQQARRMMAFCNNAGPAFLFGVAAAVFPYGWMPWALWGIHLFSAFVVAILIPGNAKESIVLTNGKLTTPSSALNHALRIMSKICGWVILFRILIAILLRWVGWYLSPVAQVLLCGILELSNGCCSLAAVENLGLRFVICSGFLGFGGLCVTLQTYSVAEGMDLSLYLPGKLAQTMISIALAMLVQPILPDHQQWQISIFQCFLPILPILLWFFLFQKRKMCSNSMAVSV